MNTEIQTIGKYQVMERISKGDLAEIFLARLEGIGGFKRLFAIKRVRSHLAQHETYAQMIEEEARIAGILSHGNIVQLLDLGREDGVLYLVMEYVDGWDLGKVLARARAKGVQVPISHAVFLGMQLLKGLEYAHSRQVIRDGERVPLDLVHRDVSPSNILLSRQGDVKLTDFGIARASLKMMETHPDLVARRFDYVSPEQAGGRDITQAADLWATAVVLYEILALTHPFRRQGELATLEAIGKGDCDLLSSHREDVPPSLEAVLHAALSVDPELRPESATAFKDSLAEVRHELGEVFTEEHMATWLRQLFEDGAEEPVDDAEEEVVAASTPEIRRPDPAAMQSPTILPAEEDLPDLPEKPDPTKPERPALGEGDEAATVVKRIKPPADKKQAKAPVPQSVDDEDATIVDRDLAQRLEDLRSFKESGGDEATRVRSDARRLLQLDGPAPAEGSGAWLAGAVASVAMLVVGMLLGAVFMVALGRSGGMVVNPPMLDVRGAPGLRMTVSIDGEEITGPRSVTPGEHRLRVDVAGAEPWEVDLTLQSGEYRLMMIEADRVAPARDDP